MRDWIKVGLAISICAVLLYLAAVGALAFVSYRATRRPDPPAPVIKVVEVDDPRLATALMIIGRQQIEIQALIGLHANYADLLDMYNNRLVAEIRRRVQE